MKHRAIAICGLIGSGKSQVGQYLSRLGHTVIDCDDIARQLACDSDIIAKVRQLLGSESIADGKLDRAYIRSVVFGNSELLASYSGIFSSAVADKVIDIASRTPVIFVQLPIFDAVKLDWYRVWNVVCNNSTRVDRTVERDSTTIDDVLAISSRQIAVVGTDTIDNSGSIAQLYQQVDKLLATL